MVGPADTDEADESEEEVDGFRRYGGEMDARGGGSENDPITAGFISKTEAAALFDL
jgi:hypothetical protein